LLKVFSDYLDNNYPEKRPAGFLSGESSCSILDAGCGVGVLGICAAGALQEAGFSRIFVRAQDRDELARVFSVYNAQRNGLCAESYEAYTEPLLAGPGGQNIILSNIPAKAGLPVLEDFVRRSAATLKQNGLVFLVAVNTLADYFRKQITAGAFLFHEENGKEHTVFVFGKIAGIKSDAASDYSPVIFDENFPRNYPFYIRNEASGAGGICGEFEMEKISYRLNTVHGAPDFDSPGGAVMAAAKLALKIDPSEKLNSHLFAPFDVKKILIHDDAGQGHFALWLANYLKREYRWVLSGRNILALAAARAALPEAAIVPAADILLDCERIAEGGAAGIAKAEGKPEGFSLIAFFPDMVPAEKNPAEQLDVAWEGLTRLAAPGTILLCGLGSTESERFDRKKPPHWHRLGNIKRKGFRSLAYLSVSTSTNGST